MKRTKILTGLLAAAIATASFGAAPVRAQTNGENLAKILLGVATVAIIADTHKRNKDQEAAAAAERQKLIRQRKNAHRVQTNQNWINGHYKAHTKNRRPAVKRHRHKNGVVHSHRNSHHAQPTYRKQTHTHGHRVHSH